MIYSQLIIQFVLFSNGFRFKIEVFFLKEKAICFSTPLSPDAGRGKGKISKHVTHGFHLSKGKSNHPMEDYLVSELRQLDNNDLGLFAIFDGHMGQDVPKYLQSHLFNNILKEVHNLFRFFGNPRLHSLTFQFEICYPILLTFVSSSLSVLLS